MIKRYWYLIVFLLASAIVAFSVFYPMNAGAKEYSPLIEYVNITHTEYTIVERVEYVQPKPFVSVDELDRFLISDNTNLGLEIKQTVILKANSDGTIDFGGQCEDYALQLRRRAAAIGKHIDTEILMPDEYYKYYHKSIAQNTSHMINKAIIGNYVYYIEPQSDRCWIGARLD